MNRTLSKAIMTRSRLKNKYNKSPNKTNAIKYKKQRNYCVNLTRKVKREYYSNLDINSFKDNKKFWNLIKPCFSDKNNAFKRITLLGDNIITVHFSVGSSENNNTNINKPKEILNVERIVNKFKNHPSVIKIKENINVENKFTFCHCTPEDMKNQIKNLNTSKPTIYNNIPAKILVKYSDIVLTRFIDYTTMRLLIVHFQTP